ncbi:MAG: TfoX/Sxy family DNA transformation protein [Pseudomonadota bacterium]
MTSRDTRPVTALRNLGPAMQQVCARADLHTVADLVEIGADAAYARMMDAGHRPHFMAYVALVLALQDRRFQSYAASEKPALRDRFDAIVNNTKAPPGIEAELDKLGVGAPRKRPPA